LSKRIKWLYMFSETSGEILKRNIRISNFTGRE